MLHKFNNYAIQLNLKHTIPRVDSKNNYSFLKSNLKTNTAYYLQILM